MVILTYAFQVVAILLGSFAMAFAIAAFQRGAYSLVVVNIGMLLVLGLSFVWQWALRAEIVSRGLGQ